MPTIASSLKDLTGSLNLNLKGNFLALPNGYTEGPRKFIKLLKPPLATSRI